MAHKCSHDFARALVDPISYSGDPLCLPATLLPLPSYKYRTTSMLNVNVPANGWGHVLVFPAFSYTGSVSSRCSLWTGTGYSGSSSLPAFGSTGVNKGFARSPIASLATTGVSGSLAVRLVTWGIEAHNVTPLLNRGGSVLAYSHPDHLSLVGGDAASFPGNPSASWTAVTGEKQSFRLCGGGPVNSDELSFTTDPADTPYAFMSFTSTEAQVYTVNLVFHWEVIQTNGSTRTPSHSDPGPSGSVLATVQNMLENNPDHTNHGSPSFYSKLKSSAMGVLSSFDVKDLGKYVKPAVAAAMAAYTGSPQPLLAYATSSMANQPKKKKPAVMPKKK